jgi:hypothetical protein
MRIVSESASGRLILGSVARIADFEERPPTPARVAQDEWATGDYVIGRVIDSGAIPFSLEAPSGRLVEVIPGDLVLGALGRRTATLQLVGDWREIDEADPTLETLNAAGVIGRITSAPLPPPASARLEYLGHATRDGERLTMKRFAGSEQADDVGAPVVLIVGTSMEAGKTVAGKAIVRQLKALGLRVVAAKLTGVGRFRDVQAMGDAGADAICDFVDGGLPSTAVPPEDFEDAARRVFARIAAARPDAVVIEAGASPLEPYNGDTAVRLLGERVRCTVLCASDPYAVVGVIDAFGTDPDLVSGRAAATDAGVELVRRLTGKQALNLFAAPGGEVLRELLCRTLDLDR